MDTDKLEDIIGPVDWIDQGRFGYLNCPGRHLHTGPTAHKDCRIHLDGIPNIFCLHESCGEVVADANKDLRQALKAEGWEAPPLTEEQRDRLNCRDRLESAATRLAGAKQFVFNEYAWPYDNIIFDCDRSWDPEHQLNVFLLDLFTSEDTVWTGYPYQTRFPHKSHFQQRDFWRSQPRTPVGPFICPNPLVPGSYDRSADCLSDRRYFVIECDSASDDPDENRDRCGAVFKYAMHVQDLKLRAVVDSGNKSLHGWFEYPGNDKYHWCRKVLPALGADPATMRLAQPVRCPGVVRDNGKLQRLLWLGGGA